MEGNSEKQKFIAYFVRHAESDGNLTGGTSIDECFSNGLTEHGKLQAACLGKYFAETKFFGVYTSDYPRAIETAEIVLNHSKIETNGPPPPIETSEDLREINCGQLQGKSYMDLALYCLETKLQPTTKFIDGESGRDAGERLMKFLTNVCERIFGMADIQEERPLNVLIISHNVAITSLFHNLSVDASKAGNHIMDNWSMERDLKFLKNVCFYKVEISKILKDPNVNALSNFKNDLFLRFLFMEKYFSKHLDAIKKDADKTESETNALITESELGRKKIGKIFSKYDYGKQIANCIQQ